MNVWLIRQWKRAGPCRPDRVRQSSVVKPASFLSASPRALAVAASSAEAGPIKQTRRHARQRSGQGFDLLQLLSPANGADPAAIVIDA
ncbi:hypothetical protein VFPBJ_02483 [Purpureocillium lilacinum]|uniref:Uncharacterized protein n=1 Tax=Purpureocillium lilacinum TaxID=33203 RepID=A0A179H0E2_PURLI|nr:hypothetical protein VFPBJ_02483 [Purpureocillium lilacinum]